MEPPPATPYIGGMDDETRAAFARIDRWFELSQEQFISFRDEVRGGLGELRGEVGELRGAVDALGSRMDRLEQRVDALGSRMDRLEQRVDALSGTVDALGGRMDRLELEMRERFISVDDQLRAARASDALLLERLAEVRDQSARQGERLDRVETGIADMNMRVDSLADDMRQRFRLVNERLGSAA